MTCLFEATKNCDTESDQYIWMKVQLGLHILPLWSMYGYQHTSRNAIMHLWEWVRIGFQKFHSHESLQVMQVFACYKEYRWTLQDNEVNSGLDFHYLGSIAIDICLPTYANWKESLPWLKLLWKIERFLFLFEHDARDNAILSNRHRIHTVEMSSNRSLWQVSKQNC